MTDSGNSDFGDAPSNPSSDSFTETTSTSWLQRLLNSFVGALVGLLLVIASIVGIFWNEGHAAHAARALAEGAALVVNVDAGAVDPANEGKLVHVAGAANATAPLVDPQFGVKARGLKLLRKVAMYQWRQDKRTHTHNKLGGGQQTVTTYVYSRVWKDGRNDSGAFRHPEGHVNPPMAFAQRKFVAGDAKLGAFSLPPALLSELGGAAAFDVGTTYLRASTAQSRPQRVDDGAIYIGDDPAEPRIGDLKISYSLAPNGPISAIGRQAGASLAPYQTRAGGTLYMIEPGQINASQMFKEAESENALLTWIVRAVALIAMWIGFMLVLSPLATLAAVIPFLGSLVGFGAGLASFAMTLVFGPLVIAIAWFTVRPLMSIGIVVAAFAVAFAASRLRSPGRSAQAPGASRAAPPAAPF